MGRPWLFSAPIDLAFLYIPVWSVWLLCFGLDADTLARPLPLWIWAVFIVGIDVAHVWSTLFRTYLDREEFGLHRLLLLHTPWIVFALAFALAAWSDWLFWRLLAYVALFHFIRQQFGFMALYRAVSGRRQAAKLFSDTAVIYLATLYPVLYWHATDDRAFSWFVEGDFILLPAFFAAVPWLETACTALYVAVLLGWTAEEWRQGRHTGAIAWGKILWLWTTAGTWYLGIVYFNSDLAFSLTNVVAHGLPYVALVFFYVEKKSGLSKHRPARRPLLFHLAAMTGLMLVLAFGEEYLWDMLLYREHGALFEQLFSYPVGVLEHPIARAAALALLSVPQATHYVLDGFIWKSGPQNPYVRRVLSPQPT